MKKVILSTIALGLMFTVAHASESDDFESLVNEVSDIATKKSLNVDYLPSVVTVIDAQTYLSGGVTTLGEALGMLPGIQMQLSPMGYTMTTVRGLKNPNAYISDKIKVMVDGVAINNEITGSSNFYMDFPIQLVDKIEVLRGPGSTTYGAGAFYGVVNVITKLGNSIGENQVFVGIGSYNSKILGGNLNVVDGDWKIFTDAYYQNNDKAIYDQDKDNSTDEALRDLSLGIKAVNGGFELLSRYKRNVSGNFYSYEGEYNPIPDKNEEHANAYFFTQLSYKIPLNAYKLETKASISHRELDTAINMYNVEDAASRFEKVGITMQEGFVTEEKTQEINMQVETILTLPTIASNDISVGVGVQRAEIKEDDFYSSVENTITKNLSAILNHPNYNDFRYRQTKEPAFWANPQTTLLNGNPSRNIFYANAEDLISLNEKTDLILGLRADNYSDFGTKYSSRAGIVYRSSDEFTYKLLYGSAFRAPTFTEAYHNGHINYRAGDENLRPEETNTYEAMAIYAPNLNNKFSLNLFYSELDNVIDLEEDEFTIDGYANYKDRYSRGVEFEYYFKNMAHNFYLNATYIDAIYTIPPEEGEISKNQSMPDISKIMYKAMYIYTPVSKLSFGTTWKYFARTTSTELQWVLDEADLYDATAREAHIFDETITYRITANAQARLSIKNIFDTDVRQPSYYYYTSDGGILREGRNFLLSYSYTF